MLEVSWRAIVEGLKSGVNRVVLGTLADRTRVSIMIMNKGLLATDAQMFAKQE